MHNDDERDPAEERYNAALMTSEYADEDDDQRVPLHVYRTLRRAGYRAQDAVRWFRVTAATQRAEDDGRVQFRWAPDEDADLSWCDAETLAGINAGRYECLAVTCATPEKRTCPHCGGDVTDPADDGPWDLAGSLAGIVVELDAEGRRYCQLVEAELAAEAGVIDGPFPFTSAPAGILYGERSACSLCGQDIEWHGPEAGWLDRGGNPTCSKTETTHRP